MGYGRRRFLAGLGAAAAAGVAAPALAETTPDVEWRLTSSFNPSLDLIYGAGQTLAKALSDLTDGHFKLKLSPAGEIAPAGEALDAVSSGKADAAHTALDYAWSQDPSFIFATSTPFGMNARQHSAWLKEGGGGAAHRRIARRPQGAGDPRRQHRRADGRLVPQGGAQPPGLAGPQDARRRLRRQSVPDAGRQSRRDAARIRL